MLLLPTNCTQNIGLHWSLQFTALTSAHSDGQRAALSGSIQPNKRRPHLVGNVSQESPPVDGDSLSLAVDRSWHWIGGRCWHISTYNLHGNSTQNEVADRTLQVWNAGASLEHHP
jgi:hypothetical protein